MLSKQAMPKSNAKALNPVEQGVLGVPAMTDPTWRAHELGIEIWQDHLGISHQMGMYGMNGSQI